MRLQYVDVVDYRDGFVGKETAVNGDGFDSKVRNQIDFLEQQHLRFGVPFLIHGF